MAANHDEGICRRRIFSFFWKLHFSHFFVLLAWLTRCWTKRVNAANLPFKMCALF
jgi:hypothetical protein